MRRALLMSVVVSSRFQEIFWEQTKAPAQRASAEGAENDDDCGLDRGCVFKVED